jgi:hypothetical protein
MEAGSGWVGLCLPCILPLLCWSLQWTGGRFCLDGGTTTIEGENLDARASFGVGLGIGVRLGHLEFPMDTVESWEGGVRRRGTCIYACSIL